MVRVASNLSRLASKLEAWLPGILLAAVLSIQQPWWNAPEFDDEGFNLGKAALFHAGFHLYRDIWNDQPPLLTVLLGGLQNPFPGNVSAARCLGLFFAAVLLFALFRIIRRSHGRSSAWASVALLASSGLFQQLSVSVMIGLPAIALATLSLDLALSPARHIWIRPVLTAAVFVAALHTKLFVFTMFPALVFALTSTPVDRSKRSAGTTVLVFAVTAVLGYYIVALAFGVPIFAQLISPHIEGAIRAKYSIVDNLAAFQSALSRVPLLLLAVAVGLFIALRRRDQPVNFVPALWLFAAVVVLLLHTPIWQHHILLILVPAAWLGGVAFGQLLSLAESTHMPALRIAGAVVFFGSIAVFQGFLTLPAINTNRQVAELQFEQALARFSRRGDWAFCDHAIDCFRSGVLVPPELVVFSNKRALGGNLGANAISEMVVYRRPAQLLLRKRAPDPELQAMILNDYVRIGNSGPSYHYVRRDRIEEEINPNNSSFPLSKNTD
jgi:hypothetical protein